MDKVYKLEYVLEHIQEFNWSDALFLPEDEKWSLETRCMILDPDDVKSDEEDLPEQALENHLMYALDIQIIQSICINVYEQKKDYSKEDLLMVFLYYYDYDAYIDL